MKHKRALTTSEIADYCSVNIRTVLRWIEKKELPAYRLPSTRGDNRVLVDDFVDFLNRNQMPVPIDLYCETPRILVVDDDEPFAESMARVLKRKKYEVSVANNGFIAGSLLSSFHPHLVTLDLSMPGIEGIEVLRFVKSHKEFSNVKILIVSGKCKEDIQEALSEGGDDYLTKPFNNNDLIEKVSNLSSIPLSSV